jgi:hypothetical protein
VTILNEIIEEMKAIETAPKKIRQFGVTFLVVFACLGGLLLYRENSLAYVSFGLGLLFLLLGMWAPGALKGFYLLWMGFALVLGYFMSRLILSILFYLVLTPIGVVTRLIGKDFLDQRWNKEADSYWIKKEKRPFDKERYKKLY